MRSIVLKFGLLGGVLISLPLFIVIINIDSIGFDKGMMILFISMIVSFISIFLGISSVRKNVGGGYIGFRTAFVSGLMITVIISVLYVVCSILLFRVIAPDFQNKYNAYALTQMKALHISQTEIDKFITETKGNEQSLFVSASMLFLKPFFFGMFFTLPSSLILRKKEFTPSLN